MRYFKTTNATRPYKAGGLSFEFEPVELIGGSSWLGILSVGEPAASVLAGVGFPQVTELTETEYDSVKKKIQEQEQQLRKPASVTSSPEPAAKCNSCGAQQPYQIRNR